MDIKLYEAFVLRERRQIDINESDEDDYSNLIL